MAKPDTTAIEQSINSLRTESAPDSVTPSRVANLLQAVVDLINALAMVPDADVADIMQLINTAVSTANAASSAASAAQTNANNKRITQFKADADALGVTLAVKQSGHTALTFLFPVADASHAGIILPTVLQEIQAAADKAEAYKITTLLYQNKTNGAQFGIRMSNGDTLQQTITLATSSRHGLMDKADKQKLDNLPSSGIVALDAAGRVPTAQAPAVMLRNVVDTTLDDLSEGDFYFDSGRVFFVGENATPVLLGPPSKNVVYCHVDTNILYRWTGSVFVPVLNDPNYAMQKTQVRRNNNTQKIYSVPNGVLAEMILSTDVVNISLQPALNGASVHRLIFKAANLGNAEQINWPGDMMWTDGGSPPDLDTIDGCDGCLVTVYDGLYAEFKYYGI